MENNNLNNFVIFILVDNLNNNNIYNITYLEIPSFKIQ